MIFIKNLYSSFLFYFFSNKKVRVSLNNKSIYMVLYTYYDESLNNCTYMISKPDNQENDLNTDGQKDSLKPDNQKDNLGNQKDNLDNQKYNLDNQKDNLEFINLSENTKIKTFLFVPEKTYIKNPSSSVFYIFSKSDDIPYSHHSLFLDPRILKITLDPPVFSFLLKSIQKQNIIIHISESKTTLSTLLLYFICIAIVYTIVKGCRYFIKKLSKLDPVFSDFNIVSSNIKKFKDLKERSMTECTICFEEFIPEDDIRVLDCKHYYHPGCIDRWLIGHSKRCPCCRIDIEINEKV